MIAVASCFSQLLSLVDRASFARAVRQHQAERGAKGFGCWDQLVAMLFCQMGGANSLREICGGLATATGKLVHLGLHQAPTRSTLAYANAHRPWQLYQTVFEELLKSCQNLAATKKRRFRFKHPLRSVDTSIIELCIKVFDWARFQRTKGAVKLHLQLDHQGCLPCWALITDGDTNDVRIAQKLDFAPGTIVVIDRGYLDYALYERWTESGVYFVTRPRTNMLYEGIERRAVPSRGNVKRDETIQLAEGYGRKRCPSRLRQVTVWDAEHERELVFLTNIFHLAASTIGAIYKDRWQIELFFKALKQNLKIKTFVGTSENAVNVQIWTALIAMLLLKFLWLKSTWAWSLSNLAAMLRFNLLSYRDLWAWLDEPFKIPIVIPDRQQLALIE
ncbi:MAG TPA: IS4 family transposase [Candidatus Binatia bacterium]|nr:IS4 family transposase [Candidatus Binatia bacterium]